MEICQKTVKDWGLPKCVAKKLVYKSENSRTSKVFQKIIGGKIQNTYLELQTYHLLMSQQVQLYKKQIQ